MILRFKVAFGNGYWEVNNVKSFEYMEGRNNKKGPHWFVKCDGGFMMHVWRYAFGGAELVSVGRGCETLA